jgi:FkbM family methyltransferase
MRLKSVAQSRAERSIVDRAANLKQEISTSSPLLDQRICCDLFIRRLTRKVCGSFCNRSSDTQTGTVSLGVVDEPTTCEDQMVNLALNKPALQSSTSVWSGSQVPEKDAMGANNGIVSGDLGFHTDNEREPWWQVDLEDEFLVHKVVIFNRRHQAQRLRRFSLLKSLNGREWTPFFRKADDAVFGATDESPFVAEISGRHLTRFVRVRLDGYGCLHFRECQVFGDRPAPSIRELILEEDARVERENREVPEGRIGYMTDVGGFTVFVDTDRYIPGIVSALDSGDYEGRERQLVTELVLPGDRVIEIGTAIGVVTMTAALIVGADNILTFDANPHIVADARENFRRNRLSGINSSIGALKHRQAIARQGESTAFHIANAFWASRLDASPSDPEIVETVQVPVFCLEDEIKFHQADVLICDIEGGETELLTRADLSGIRKIIMETHYWSAGEAATDAMIRKLILDGFAIHLGHSGQHVIFLRR